MFDIGGWEFLIVIVIAIIVIGPKDLPATIRTVSGWIRRARELAREFQSGLEDLAREAEIDSVKKDIETGLGVDEISDAGNTIRNRIERTIDPDREIEETFREDPSHLDEDGPFADNSFEEDEDIDGADFDETMTPEEPVTRKDEPGEAATPGSAGEDDGPKDETAPGQAAKKADG